MPLPQVAQRAIPPSSTGLVTNRGGVFAGLREARLAWTLLNNSCETMAGTAEVTHSSRGLTAQSLGAAPVENQHAVIGAAGEDAVHAGGSERLAAQRDALGVQLRCDRLDAERQAALADSQVVDAAHHSGLRFVDRQALLDLGAPPLGLDGDVAEGRDGAVPEILPRVFAHGAERVLAVLGALIFVEAAEDLADQVAAGVVGEGLGDRDHVDAGAAQPADVEFVLQLVAEEARHRVDQRNVVGAPGEVAASIICWKTGRRSSVPEAPGSM